MIQVGRSLTRRRFLYLASVAMAAPVVGARPALAADTWYQNFAETELWSRASGGQSVDRAPQWSYFKALGPQESKRFSVEHPVSKKKVYIDAAVIGLSGAPDPSWTFARPRSQTAAPAPVAAAVITPPAPAPAPVPIQGGWVASFSPAQLWTAPEPGAILLGEADAGSFFKVLEPQKGPRLKVQDPITSGEAFIEAKSVGPVGGPPAIPRVPSRWWGYVGSDDINVRSEPTGAGERVGTLAKGTPVVVESWVGGQEVFPDQPGWAKLGEGVYVYSPLLRKAAIETPPAPPAHGPLADRWIDLNLTQQTVTAYERDRPVYMTVTSSGRPGWETREGLHEILWRKEKETMDSTTLLGQDAARASYRIENIRWTQYFTKDGQAIHENFWRDEELFGVPGSHGCAGMVAQDALWFWLWAKVGTPISVHY